MDISSYGDAIGRVAPGTFVPDISPQSSAPLSTPLDAGDGSDDSGGVSFKDTLAGMLGHVNSQMIDAEQKSEDYALGKSDDMEGTVKSVEEAGLGLSMAMSVRNKILQAYTTISEMQF